MEVIQNRKPTEKNEKDERNKRSPLNVTHENSPEANPQATPKPGHWGMAGGWSLKKRPLGKRETSTNPSFFEVPHLSVWGCSIICVPYILSTKQCFLLGGSSDDSYKQLSRLVCGKPSASHIRHPSSLEV